MERKASVLIVDDNISLCKTMSFVLERKGYAATIAKNGLEAIEKVKEKTFDIIFIDIKMPLIDGVETYRRIKEIRPEAVAVMMTGYAVEDLIEQALREGAYGVIYKPLDMEKVVSLIGTARQEKQGILILVVDEDPGTCITLKNILTGRGYKVGIAHTGEDAIIMAQERGYGIIFVDMKLPTISGLETYSAIRGINPEVVTIMMTAYRQETAELVKQTLNDNACTCIYKPLDMAEVLRLVDQVQRMKQGER